MAIISIYYHMVSDDYIQHVSPLYKFKTEEEFENDVKLLSKHYEFIDLDSIKTKKKGIILTFDDGYSECFSTIFPILEKYNIKGYFFLNNDFIDNKAMFSKLSKFIENQTAKGYLLQSKPYLTTENIRVMIKSGHYFGGHTFNHESLKDKSSQEQIRILVDSALDIQARFSLDYSLVSIPHNDRGISKYVLSEVSKKVDYIFGGFGLKQYKKYHYFRRISNEHKAVNIRKFILQWRLLHLLTNK